MKNFLKIAFATTVALAVATPALADVHVTPLVGYQFQTTNTQNKQIDTIGEFQRNHATYGLQVAADVDANTQVGVEYLRSDSNIDSYQVGFVGNKTLIDNVYATGGLGYSKLSGNFKNQEGTYINVGVGVKQPLTNLITGKVEVRGQYLTNQNQWTPVALVGFEFNTDQLFKPYSR